VIKDGSPCCKRQRTTWRESGPSPLGEGGGEGNNTGEEAERLEAAGKASTCDAGARETEEGGRGAGTAKVDEKFVVIRTVDEGRGRGGTLGRNPFSLSALNPNAAG